ncbi:CHAD domain-containing protein [Paraburkholderia sp. CNPSo 3272]|uniref:CHAD domain-containing protein n=1 Tax=Paraburkholderia sp. CNPSo 3272 TaxID=2940931 RepID=UPI0020B890A3|nr:CHAD domain-containing protein [Paraburkholderia sp. CNPSo 3272]MCP3726316.1 CHAD domain-containing protein [Paraburkholderia sp. CNPSo 3272]
MDKPATRSKNARSDAQSQFSRYAQPLVREALARVAALDTEPETMHQLRVALRRLRTLLWAWRPLLGRAKIEPQRAFLKRAAAAAGEVRDWDIAVALLGTDGALANGHLAPVRQAAREHARQTLSAADLKHTLRDMLHEVNRALNTSPRRTPLKRLARERVRVARRSLATRMQRARRAKRRDYAAWHEVRKGAKRLRYLLEFFGSILPRRENRRVKSLKKLQDRFGKLNDAVASERLVAQHREIFPDSAKADAALSALGRERKKRRRKAAKLLH